MDVPETQYSLLHSLIAGSRRLETWQVFDAAYRPVIVQWCQRRGLKADDAAEFLQDFLVRAPEKLATFDPAKGKFRSWLKTVVQNAVTDLQRRMAKSLRIEASGSTTAHELLQNLAAPEAIDALATGMEGVESRSAEVCARVRARNELHWSIFWALVMEGRTPAEVSAEYDTTLASVYKIKQRTTRELHQEYRNVFGIAPDPLLPGTDDPAEPAGG